jgi:hypothetical protein
MHPVGLILILLLILLLIAGAVLAVYFYEKNKKKKEPPGPTSPTGPPSPPGPTSAGYDNISIITPGTPSYGLTTDTDNNVIVYNPHDPIGPTGPTGFANVCSRYNWLYGGATGTMSGAAGQTGTASGETGTYIISTWATDSNKYLQVKLGTSGEPSAGNPVIIGPTGSDSLSRWLFIPDPDNNKTGKFCLDGITGKSLCLYYGTTGYYPINGGNLVVDEYIVGYTGPGFSLEIPPVLSTESIPTCNPG